MATNSNRASLYWSPDTKARLKLAVEKSDVFRSVSALTEYAINQYMDAEGIPKPQAKRKLI